MAWRGMRGELRSAGCWTRRFDRRISALLERADYVPLLDGDVTAIDPIESRARSSWSLVGPSLPCPPDGRLAVMCAVATFLVVAVITLALGQLATGALIATGVPPEIAASQARSAFSGAGFTTTEEENVVNHRARRRIIATTMFPAVWALRLLS